MVPAHHLLEIRLLGCPDPNPRTPRFFDPRRDALPTDLDRSASDTSARWRTRSQKWLRRDPEGDPIGVPFSGGIDSGAVLLVTYKLLLRLGISPRG